MKETWKKNKKQTVSLKTSLNIEIIHTCGPIHQQFNWLPKLTRSCSLLQVALLTLRPLVSSPLEVGVNTQLNDTHLTPFLSSFLSFLSVCLQARCFHSVQRSPPEFCRITPFPQHFNNLYSFAYGDDTRVVSLLSGLSFLPFQPIRFLSSINHQTVTPDFSVPVCVEGHAFISLQLNLELGPKKVRS